MVLLIELHLLLCDGEAYLWYSCWVTSSVACKNSHLPLLLTVRMFSKEGRLPFHQQKFHADDVKSVHNLVRSSEWST